MIHNMNRNRSFSKLRINNARYEPQGPIIPQFSINNYVHDYPYQASYSQNMNEYYPNNFNEQKIPYKTNISINRKEINNINNQDIYYLKDKLYQLEQDNKFLIEENNHLKKEYNILNGEYGKIEFAKEDLLNHNLDLKDRLITLDKEFKRLEEDYNMIEE